MVFNWQRTIQGHCQDLSSVWFAGSLRGQHRIHTLARQLQERVWLATNTVHQSVIVKGVHSSRPENEKVLKHVDDTLINASATQKIIRREVRHDLKPQNVLVNYGQGDLRFTDVQLSNWGNSAPAYDLYTRYRDLIGTPTWRSPEAHLRIGWGTPTDCQLLGPFLLTYFVDCSRNLLVFCHLGTDTIRPARMNGFACIPKKNCF
ncbi:hypothetical protein BDV30DRAFT_224753 [Aspergillus minisclerotigenes]|uniref:Protein kinase domain-containing protein n=1 Tax=Aspergillus minisclerotigenes TaxID=656917 RepID=A0A5N6JB29_9EURO|nr:hypothetical protein BDV30DRAFT_224753 [Aspergillus minisclerotigenes]